MCRTSSGEAAAVVEGRVKYCCGVGECGDGKYEVEVGCGDGVQVYF